MKTKKRNLIAVVMLMAFAIAFAPANQVQAQEGDIIASGRIGSNAIATPNAFWELNQAGVLTITGVGQVSHFGTFDGHPWWHLRELIVEIVVGEGITALGNNAFAQLPNLRTIRLPSTLTTTVSTAQNNLASDNWFLGSVALENIFVAAGNAAGFSDIDGVLFFQERILVRYPVGRTDSTYVIPSQVTRINLGAFSHHRSLADDPPAVRSLTQVIIPDGVDSIGNLAFEGAGLTSVILPASLRILGQHAFRNNTDLTGHITIPAGVTNIPFGAFMNTAITSVEILGNVTALGATTSVNATNMAGASTILGAFKNTQLTTINLPNSLTLDGFNNGVALDIPTLQTITVTPPVGDVPHAFVVVDNVLYVRYPASGAITSYRVARYPSSRQGGSTTWTIPATINVGGTNFPVSGIATGAFFGNQTLTSIDFSNISPEFVQIGNFAFGQTALTSITIQDSTDVNPHSLFRIGAGAFYNSTALTTVRLPNTLTNLNNDAFRSCSTLVTINLHETGVTGRGAADANRGFLGNTVFANTVSLDSITLPDSLAFISTGMFWNSGLTSITIPASVTGVRPPAIAPAVVAIQDNAFRGTPLTTVTVEWDWPLTASATAGSGNVHTGAFHNIDRTRVVLNVPTAAEPTYRAADFWRDFAFASLYDGLASGGDITWECFDNGLLVISGTGPMDDFAIAGDGTTAPWDACRTTTQVIVIDTTITSIGAYAFRGFGSLGAVTIPATVDAMGAHAFLGANMLGTVNVAWHQPLAINADVFDTIALKGVRLNVPAVSRIAYFQAPVWQEFNIGGINAGTNGLAWFYEAGTRTLYITGAGAMGDYDYHTILGTTAPWAEHSADIRFVNIAEGVTSIGDFAFANHTALSVVTIPASVTSIGHLSFMNTRSLRVVDVELNGGSAPAVGPVSFAGVNLGEAFLLGFEGSVYRYAAVWRDFRGHEIIRGIAPVITTTTNVMHLVENRPVVGVPYAFQLTATSTLDSIPGRPALLRDALVWSVTGAGVTNRLPPGLTLTTAGLISGTPTQAGTFTFTVWASNLTGRMSRNFTLTVNQGDVPRIERTTLANGEVGIAYSVTFADSSSLPATWALSGNVPHGLSLDNATGVLSGTPTTAGVFTFRVVATNDLGRDTASFRVEITGTSFADLVNELNLLLDACRNNADSLQGIINLLEIELDDLQKKLDACLAGNVSNSPHIPMEQVNIYPNPVTNALNVVNFDWTAGDVVELFDMGGRRVFMERVNAPVETFTINMSSFQSGTYILRIGNRVARVIKQ